MANEYEAGRPSVGEYQMDELDQKVVRHFAGKVVRKDLSALMKSAANVPTFVLEYLLGMYCSSDDPALVEEGLERIRRILTENYARADESERIKSTIRERGAYTVIDKVSAYLDEHNDCYIARFANLQVDPFVFPEEYATKYPKVLSGGMWSIMRIEYRRPEDDFDDPLDDIFGGDPSASRARRPRKRGGKRGVPDSPFAIASLTPIQMPNLTLSDLTDERPNFSTDEWIRLLLRSAGYEPDVMSPKERLHFVERMVPLAERNYNLCELGPRGTGKSHIYKEVSPYSILLSGGQTTTANLFGRMNGPRGTSGVGLVSMWDCITFDEVAGMRFKDQNAIQVLKDYMASGSYARGRDQVNADGSIVLEGNINDTVANVLKTTHLFDPFPPEFHNDSAFFDRIHCYLPGWEIPKMRADLLTGRYGLITDCLSEFCREMRRFDFSHNIDRYFRLNADFNKRDDIAVRKTFSGMAKLLFPDERMSKEDVRMVLEYAIEGRRRVKEQLRIMAGVEFIDTDLGYVDLDTKENRIVYVPEQRNDALIADASLLAGHVYSVAPSQSGEYAVYKLENRCTLGEGRFQTEGIGNSRSARESMDAAFTQFTEYGERVAWGIDVADKDYLLYFSDVQSKGPSDGCSLAEFVGLCSAACSRPVAPGLVVPGVLHVSGTMDPIRDLEDVIRMAANAGARRILLPMGTIADLARVPRELLGSVSPDFYPDGDIVAAARKALGL